MNDIGKLAGPFASKSLGRRKSLHHELVESLRQMILTGELAPGSRVPELAICEQFEVSRTPLREALKVLAAEGLIVLLPNRGCMVSEIEKDDVAAAFEMLSHLELLIGQLVVENASDDELLAVMKMHTEMLPFHVAEDRPEYFRRNQEIHMALAQLTGNHVLTDIYESLAHKIMRARSFANFTRLRWDESLREHNAFMEALMERDKGRLSFLLRDHAERTRVSVMEQMKSMYAYNAATGKAQLDG